MSFESPLAMSICPRITADQDRLIASTSTGFAVLTLGFGFRRVIIDRAMRTVTITRRIAWFFTRTKVINFNQIEGVTYGYEDANPAAFFSSTHNAIDRFVVGLRLIGADEERLFSFVGDGAFTNDGPLPDWWYWKDIAFDLTGSQERESRVFVELVSKLIGVSLVPSTLVPMT